mgnify:FL=1
MKIFLTDGLSIEVPYYWEEAGEVKFEHAGGIAGIPNDQVVSIQEVLTSKEFDPEVLLQQPGGMDPELPQAKDVQKHIETKLSSMTCPDNVPADEAVQLLTLTLDARKKALAASKVRGPRFKVDGKFSELCRSGPRLVMQNIVVSRADLKSYNFLLTLYNENGEVLQKKPCEVVELEGDRKALRKLQLPGRIYAVVASVDIHPDSKISRYDISTTPR